MLSLKPIFCLGQMQKVIVLGTARSEYIINKVVKVRKEKKIRRAVRMLF